MPQGEEVFIGLNQNGLIVFIMIMSSTFGILVKENMVSCTDRLATKWNPSHCGDGCVHRKKGVREQRLKRQPEMPIMSLLDMDVAAMLSTTQAPTRSLAVCNSEKTALILE